MNKYPTLFLLLIVSSLFSTFVEAEEYNVGRGAMGCPGFNTIGCDQGGVVDDGTIPPVETGTIITPTEFLPGDAVIFGVDELQDKIKNLKEGEVIIHVYQDHVDQEPRYAIVSAEHVHNFEIYSNIELQRWKFSHSIAADNVPGTIMKFLANIGLADNFMSDAYNDDIQFLQTKGDTYSQYSDLLSYASTLDSNDPHTISNIYTRVQETIKPDNGVYQNYNWHNGATTFTQKLSPINFNDINLQQALQCGRGACRHSAPVLATALEAAGYETATVFSERHMWVRVYTPEKIFDLDPNAYITYTELPVRDSASGSNQVMPVPPKPRPLNFFEKWFFNQAYAETNDVSTTCFKIGFCMNTVSAFYVKSDFPHMTEVWGEIDGNFLAVGLRLNLEKATVNDIPNTKYINIMGQRVRVFESTYTLSDGSVVYVVEGLMSPFSDVLEESIVTVISDAPILSRQAVLDVLADGHQLSSQDKLKDIQTSVVDNWKFALTTIIICIAICVLFMRKFVFSKPPTTV